MDTRIAATQSDTQPNGAQGPGVAPTGNGSTGGRGTGRMTTGRMGTGTVVLGWTAFMGVLVIAGVLLTTSRSQARTAASGGDGPDDRFNSIVRTLQTRAGVENTSPPFMWLASLAVRAARPAGVLDLRLATFEGRQLADVVHNDGFDRLVREATADGWTPLLRVRSKRSRELVNILSRTRHDQVSLLLVTVNQGDAVVAQVAVNPETIVAWIKDPVHINARFHHSAR